MATTNVPAQFSREAEVAALGRALAVERRARYIDFRGKRTTFSRFMKATADKLCKRFPTDSRWSTIRGLFQMYANLDVAARISIVRRTEELLFIEEKDEDVPPPPPEPGSSPLVRMNPMPGPKKADPPPPPPKPARPVQDPFSTEIKFVKGVGPKLAEVFNRMNIFTAGDLIRHYPRHHLDFQNRLLIRELEPGQEVTVFGTIRSVGAFQAKRGNMSILTIVIGDGTGSVIVSRFIGGRSNKYLLDRYKDQYPKGAQVLASGVVERDRYSGRLQLKQGEIEILSETSDGSDEYGSLHTNRLVPVYPLTEGLGLRYLRSVIHNALEAFDSAIKDPLPDSVKLQNNLIGLKEALWGIHFPENVDEKDAARRRLVFDELFGMQLQLAHRRELRAKEQNALALPYVESGLIQVFRKHLPFTLTGAQERVFKEVAADLGSSKPMHRLVQGDVGSGKTVVAALSALVAIDNGYQAAIMAPTEILAEQHFRQFQKWLTPLGLRCALFLGKQGTKERREMQQALASGQVNIAVGTHALIQDEVEFANLGLIIIDEQHRFGVKQRARLKAKGENPQLLTMTATPIPRTLALTVHGDLDVSVIDELPPGRKPIETKIVSNKTLKEKMQVKIREQVVLGRQAYIVFPLIDESESLSAKAATAEYELLRNSGEWSGFTFGLMHGKLKPAEKDAVMESFRKGEFQILVSTTVIEVGVDVPNASVMVIENADRFGLAQLHQLRGRVGRGADQSYCYLVANASNEQTRQRLEIMELTNDGFVVAEKDLELRGPGEFLGTRQSGMPDLVLADLVQDATILEQARKAAIALIKSDPDLSQHASLKVLIQNKANGEAAHLMQSG